MTYGAGFNPTQFKQKDNSSPFRYEKGKNFLESLNQSVETHKSKQTNARDKLSVIGHEIYGKDVVI